ncbi:4Fe-4S dicluster protein [Ruminiclostridium sufflavum DSM 19573]|uniref:4Fe-4S dicluster protein n=1 Tax=Ruminiclostridium sufflavum DSM 19573 TaxID=1121337 RepID=A0A318XLK5_9FIRM|nr:Coenzyme F420 hydrogenase/dehydrogenase, beta subunit C-terminal domain [Ruminiclostridium sufflavum]PYG86559.1 4Fe-4S dicluster protein [Ruminiclostridium sufflavum DSM 19573]
MPAFIKIDKKEDCYGCRVCEQICPHNCISVSEDAEGFKYPAVDENLCTECGICIKHCPKINNTIFEESQLKEPEVFAAKLKNEQVLLKSSSGGMFSAIAELVIEKGGVVFGCALDKDFIAKHICVENKVDLEGLRGSKYVQSDLNSSYLKARDYLMQGRLVFYTGTPCQISGLKAFLGKDCENLITADLICHGTPSQKLFSKYLDWLQNNLGEQLLTYEFRNKDKMGWGLCYKAATRTKTKYSHGDFDPYYSAFLKAKTYRYTCYSCKYATTVREGDFTLADYWGIELCHSKFYSSKGVSLLLINSLKGQVFFEELKGRIDYIPSKLEYAKMKNGNLEHPAKKPYIRDFIYKELDSMDFDTYLERNLKLDSKFRVGIKLIVPIPIKIALKKLLYKIKEGK